MPGLAGSATRNGIEASSRNGDHDDFYYQLIGKIYEAGSAPELWPSVLTDLTTLVDGTKAFLVHHDLAANTARVCSAHNVDPAYLCAYASGIGAENPWLAERCDHTLIGEVVKADTIVPRTDLHETRFYREFLKPLDLEHILLAGITVSGDRQIHLVVGRPESMAPFSDHDVGLCQPLVSHLHRAWQIQNENARQEFVEQGTVEALNLLSVGVAMVDADGKVLAMNDAADAIIRNGDGLRIGRVGLETSEGGKAVTPAGLIARCAENTPAAPFEPISVLAVPRPSGRRPYSLLVCPFSGVADPWDDVQTAALVFISDPESTTGGYGSELLRHVYKLTPAEARVATMVAQGHRVLDIAEQLKISVHTARTHLKRIFEKTGVERQAELVQLLYGSLSLLRSDMANGVNGGAGYAQIQKVPTELVRI